MNNYMNNDFLNCGGFPKKCGLYDPAYEHDACGVGFVAKLDAVPTHQLVKDAVNVLINLEHRGAVGADKKTGDGAGLLVELPDRFFRIATSELGIELPALSDYAAGMVFLPTDKKLADKCMKTLEKNADQEGAEILGWRKVPTSNKHLGIISTSSQPEIMQIFIDRAAIPKEDFERKLYIIRRLTEKEISAFTDADYTQFYICSLSSRNITYKGLITGSQLTEFYPDLLDEEFKICYSIVHQRYSTNTFPTWPLAQPFRYMAHNGEINTLRGNINRMRAREAAFESQIFGEDIEKIKPILIEGQSDSAIFDNAFELLIASGRSLPHVIMMMIPECWTPEYILSIDKQRFYEYQSAIMEPWDGPAAIAVTDGRYIGCSLDRNGLRPCRYSVTKEGLIVMASETGVIDIAPENLKFKGRLQPGKMLLVDLKHHRILPDIEAKSMITRQKPYRKWIENNKIIIDGIGINPTPEKMKSDELLIYQHAFGYSYEDLHRVIAPMAVNSMEQTGSMGNDAALAALSNHPRMLYNYFKQLFAQVTNPPIDPLREELVMSTMMTIGREHNLLEETPQHIEVLQIPQPILSKKDIEKIKNCGKAALKVAEIDILFPSNGDGKALEKSLNEVFEKAEQAIEQDNAGIILLTDKNISKEKAPIPALLAVAGLHHYLIQKKLRTKASIIIETGEAREIMHFALLIGYGASAIHPYIAFASVNDMAGKKLLGQKIKADKAVKNYIKAINKGLLKTLSRMGISTLRSYFCAQIFEAIGISSKVIEKYFTNTTSKIEGIGLEEIAKETIMRYKAGYPSHGRVPSVLASGGLIHLRDDGEKHLMTSEAISIFQNSLKTGDYKEFKKYTDIINNQSKAHITLRSLLKFKKRKSIPIEEVEPFENIIPRFVAAAMSFGSISRAAHETIAIAMNRIGGRSNSGEGGEDPQRYIPMPNGDSKRSKVKQVASGRFGVTTEYLINADELQIKIAQGAKPGEGGQLPGHKVSRDIARVRHTTPWVTLISPPPHHDIYSIEDLAQLIADLKAANPDAKVSVKLVSEVGVGTVAAGVAKGKADLVVVSGYDGGTGASPVTSIQHAGLPWELGLSDTQQTLVNNLLRDRIKVQVDGQLRTGRDLAIAALLGADEFAFGSIILIALGCVMMRKCHLNTCPVGIATQEKELVSKFGGKPEYIENFFRFLIQELREIMAELGFKTLNDMIGQVDNLEMDDLSSHWKAKTLDFSGLLHKPQVKKGTALHQTKSPDHPLEGSFNLKLLDMPQIKDFLNTGNKTELNLPIVNTERTLGTTLAGKVVNKFGPYGLDDDSLVINFKGSAGQSFGAFLAKGMTFKVEGDANDYVAKGLAGGKIIIIPPKNVDFDSSSNIIVGNVVLYGATRGECYFSGVAGERFCIRNSGAKAVVEGVGDHGCEYMTGGVAVILGKTGVNFAAGMSGGFAFVYDEDGLFDTRCNLEMVDLEPVTLDEDKKELKSLIENHYEYTESKVASKILDDWENKIHQFVKVFPIDYRQALKKIKAEKQEEEQNQDKEETLSK